jgi:hypothetical protein
MNREEYEQLIRAKGREPTWREVWRAVWWTITRRRMRT